ncbi:DUF3604 domain-containing protein [Pacificimonas sp. WHA3]|uniref:DUF3604 domain-containing protein n=1 Tax=Pacificimonas pallii TaxID=2827236 RepID=A0ABS6SDY9_9SPHN|nr:DUF3604 domain-containing protein [Pacificimonas pallii]MBV7256619.1 DUF3604 domain-containing protein [Pacificimonas pallii]
MNIRAYALLLGVSMIAACGVEPGAEADVRAARSAAAFAVETNPDRNAYFGDLHVHTRASFDAYIFNIRATADDAYRFAKGQPLKHPAGYEVSAPALDFYAVTDHGEYLGVVPAMDGTDSPLAKTALARQIFGADALDPRAAFTRIGLSAVTGQPIAEIYDLDHIASVWRRHVEAADRHYEPGRFTTFAGYEYTAMRPINPIAGTAANLHRNVIFEDAAAAQPFSASNSPNPEDLWDWMDGERSAGRDVLAIPHNSNISGGQMFARESYHGEAFTDAYAEQRGINEPLVEIAQVKGTSETHPQLSPNDEWASFEMYEAYINSNVKSDIPGGFVREAYRNGLAKASEGKPNPFRFGIIGSSDVHMGGGAQREDRFWGKFGTRDATPALRGSVPPGAAKSWGDMSGSDQAISGIQLGAAGLAGVWATANTREAIFAAMRRKETFGTSGPRIRVRMFAGYDFPNGLLSRTDAVAQADRLGVAMGGRLAAKDAPPMIAAWAMRDPGTVPLQRLQVIKVSAVGGVSSEQVYDVACADGMAPDAATHRCADNGARVDVTSCETIEGKGAGELKAMWRDPDYKPGEQAAYYVRALENPKCRWSTWDAVRNGTPPRPDVPATVQDRAWTSPVWVDAR